MLRTGYDGPIVLAEIILSLRPFFAPKRIDVQQVAPGAPWRQQCFQWGVVWGMPTRIILAIVMRRRIADWRGGIVSDAVRFAYTGRSAMKTNRELSLQLQRSWRVVRYRLAELIRGQ